PPCCSTTPTFAPWPSFPTKTPCSAWNKPTRCCGRHSEKCSTTPASRLMRTKTGQWGLPTAVDLVIIATGGYHAGQATIHRRIATGDCRERPGTYRHRTGDRGQATVRHAFHAG